MDARIMCQFAAIPSCYRSIALLCRLCNFITPQIKFGFGVYTAKEMHRLPEVPFRIQVLLFVRFINLPFSSTDVPVYLTYTEGLQQVSNKEDQVSHKERGWGHMITAFLLRQPVQGTCESSSCSCTQTGTVFAVLFTCIADSCTGKHERVRKCVTQFSPAHFLVLWTNYSGQRIQQW